MSVQTLRGGGWRGSVCSSTHETWIGPSVLLHHTFPAGFPQGHFDAPRTASPSCARAYTDSTFTDLNQHTHKKTTLGCQTWNESEIRDECVLLERRRIRKGIGAKAAVMREHGGGGGLSGSAHFGQKAHPEDHFITWKPKSFSSWVLLSTPPADHDKTHLWTETWVLVRDILLVRARFQKQPQIQKRLDAARFRVTLRVNSKLVSYLSEAGRWARARVTEIHAEQGVTGELEEKGAPPVMDADVAPRTCARWHCLFFLLLLLLLFLL